MASAGTVGIDFDANIVRLERKLATIDKRTKSTARKMKRNLTDSFGAIRNAALAVFGGQAIRSIVNAGNSMESFERTLTVATGSANKAAQEMDFLREIADELGINLEQTASAYTKFSAAAKGSVLQGQSARDIFTSVSKAARVLNLSASDTGGVFKALEQIMSKGKVQAEELRGQLGERLPGAFNLAAKAMGVTTAELDKLLKDGKVAAEDLLPGLAKELDRVYGSAVASASSSAAANIERFNNALFESKVAVSEGLLPAISLLTRKLADGIPIVTDFAEKMGEIFAGGQGFDALADSFEEPIRRLQEERDRILRQMQDAQRPFVAEQMGQRAVDEALTKYRARLSEVTEELTKLKAAQLDAFDTSRGGGSGADELNEILVTSTKRADTYGQSLAALKKRFASAEEQAAKLRKTLEFYRDDLSAGQIRAMENEIADILFGGIDEVELKIRKQSSAIKDAMKTVKKETSDLGRTFQSAFEDAIVGGNKFRDVLQGLLQDLLRIAVRRSISEPLGNWFGSLFDGGLTGKASGGFVGAGTPYMVGEKGRELFVPDQNGTIIPNHKLQSAGGVSIVQDIKIAPGVSWAELSTALPIAFRQNNEALKAELTQMRAEGAF
jgi:tape measure domain-containing protein